MKYKPIYRFQISNILFRLLLEKNFDRHYNHPMIRYGNNQFYEVPPEINIDAKLYLPYHIGTKLFDSAFGGTKKINFRTNDKETNKLIEAFNLLFPESQPLCIELFDEWNNVMLVIPNTMEFSPRLEMPYSDFVGNMPSAILDLNDIRIIGNYYQIIIHDFWREIKIY